MSYHLDERPVLPLLLTAVGLRVDGSDGRLADQSRAAARVLKEYVHEIANKAGRGAHIDIDASPVGADDLARLGFVKAPKLKNFRPSGLHLRQRRT